MSAGGSKRAILAALLANLGIAVAKFVGFLITGSSSMLAESVHSGADTSNQALLLWGGRQAQRTADAAHPFGYGRERFFWSFVVALVLFSLGSLFAIYEGIDKIRHPHELESLGWAIGILVLAVVLEGYSFRTAVIESNHVRGDANWAQFIRHSRTPELPVVLLEDFGALIGLFLALGALALASITDEPVWDGIGTLSIGVLLGLIAITLAVEMKSLLIGEGALPEHVDQLRAAIEANDDVDRLIHMRTEHIGPEELLVAAKVSFRRGMTTSQLADAIDAAETRARQAVPIARLIYLEPDLYDVDHVEHDDIASGTESH
jgi:cation diffusion facilitator family transporter